MMNFHGLLLLIIDEELPFDTQMSLVSNAMKMAPLRNCRQMPGDISAMTFMLRRYHSWRTCQETKLFDFASSEFDFRNVWEKSLDFYGSLLYLFPHNWSLADFAFSTLDHIIFIHLSMVATHAHLSEHIWIPLTQPVSCFASIHTHASHIRSCGWLWKCMRAHSSCIYACIYTESGRIAHMCVCKQRRRRSKNYSIRIPTKTQRKKNGFYYY